MSDILQPNGAVKNGGYTTLTGPNTRSTYDPNYLIPDTPTSTMDLGERFLGGATYSYVIDTVEGGNAELYPYFYFNGEEFLAYNEENYIMIEGTNEALGLISKLSAQYSNRSIEIEIKCRCEDNFTLSAGIKKIMENGAVPNGVLSVSDFDLIDPVEFSGNANIQSVLLTIPKSKINATKNDTIAIAIIPEVITNSINIFQIQIREVGFV